jgi:hypothetical protein
MIRDAMAEEKRDDVELVHPNRDKPAVKATKAIVILLLLVSVGLMVVIAIGGWTAMMGAKPLLIGYVLVYLVMAFYAGRWNRGVLPLAAALAIILLIFAAISGPEWFARDKTGFANPTLSSSILGLLTFILIPVQILLIAFSMRGFGQDWHVEIEQTPAERKRGGSGGGQPALASGD